MRHISKLVNESEVFGVQTKAETSIRSVDFGVWKFVMMLSTNLKLYGG